MEEALLLLAISNASVRAYAWAGGGGLGNEHGRMEGVKIMPHYPFLKVVVRYLFEPLKPALAHLDRNVAFLAIGDRFEAIRISCDWCSICNGMVETAKQNLIDDPDLVARIDLDRLRKFDRYLDFVLVDRTDKVTNRQVERWCEATFGTPTVALLLFSQVYLKIESIELRWCPFKRSRASYYRNQDGRYVEPSERMIYEMGKALSLHETMTCVHCPRVVNDHWPYPKSDRPSIFQPLLDHMMAGIRAATTTTKARTRTSIRRRRRARVGALSVTGT